MLLMVSELPRFKYVMLAINSKLNFEKSAAVVYVPQNTQNLFFFHGHLCFTLEFCKYNLSAFGTYFECEGVKRTY